MSNKEPRRIRMDLWWPAETAIHNAIQEVERMPADVRLTNVVISLLAAQGAVADWIDDKADTAMVTDEYGSNSYYNEPQINKQQAENETDKVKRMIHEFANLLMYFAWRQAANAYRMYPDNKHTYAASEEYLDSKLNPELDKLMADLKSQIATLKSESSVWSGELTEAQKLTFSHIVTKIEGIGELDLAKWLKQWLQSRTAETKSLEQLQFEGEISGFKRTAVKAEEIQTLKDKYEDMVSLCQFYQKKYEQSQPTAGGVKEEEQWDDPAEVMILKDALKNIVSCIDNENPTHENIWRIADAALNGIACAPPSPSNPSIIPYLKLEQEGQLIRMKALGINTEGQSFEQAVNAVIFLAGENQSPKGIKRPTDVEVRDQGIYHARKWSSETMDQTNYRAGFAAAINWLLSLQSDK